MQPASIACVVKGAMCCLQRGIDPILEVITSLREPNFRVISIHYISEMASVYIRIFPTDKQTGAPIVLHVVFLGGSKYQITMHTHIIHTHTYVDT